MAIPFSVHAGFFSSLFSIWKEKPAESVSVEKQDAQDVTLLASMLSVDPFASRGGGDILVEEGALVPDGDLRNESEYKRTSSKNGEISVYVVREGDSLSQIAKMFDVTTNTILWANDISDPTTIQAGDTLVILPIAGVRHVVKTGDTIGSIAKKYEGDVDEILSYNQLTSVDEISVGTTLVIPGGEISTPVSRHIVATPTRVSGSGSTVSGWLSHPLPGAIKTQGIHGYNGVDLATSYGTPIRAAAAGEVIVSKATGWNGGYGSYVVIRHGNGTQTLYAHNSSNEVSVGQYVAQGQAIAHVGNSGHSTGPHLHFEVRGSRNPF